MDPSTGDQGATHKTPTAGAAAVDSTACVVPASTATVAPVAASVGAVAPVGGPKTSTKPKGKRTTLSIHEKFIVKTFCDQQINESKARADFVPSHDVLRQEILAKFGWEVGRSTLSKIMCLDWQQLQVQAHPNPNMKRKRKPLFPAFEDDLVKSMRAHLARQESMSQLLAGEGAEPAAARTAPYLTEAFIMEEAQRLKQQHGIKDEELVLSVGWLARFKQRHGIRLRKGTATVGDGGDAVMSGLAYPGRPLPLGDGATKRQKRNTTDQLAHWPSIPQFPLAYNCMGMNDPRPVDSLLSLVVSVSLRATCSSHPKTEDDASDPVDTIPPALADRVPPAVLQFACPHCPSSLPMGISGLNVVVIGFNCVRDAFLAAAMVGDQGSVTCIEANPTAAMTAAKYVEPYTSTTLGYTRENFRLLNGSTLDHASFSNLLAQQDIVCVNCSFHNAVNKAQVLELAFNLLQEGGECRVSYVSSSRRLHASPPLDQAPTDTDLGSASVYTEDFRRMCQHVGFLDPRYLHVRKFEPSDHGDGAFSSTDELGITTTRLFKLGLVEDRAEDYGERATYVGDTTTDSGSALVCRLDSQFTFMRDVSVAVDGNTSQILRLSWLKRMFNVEGDRLTHHGRFIGPL